MFGLMLHSHHDHNNINSLWIRDLGDNLAENVNILGESVGRRYNAQSSHHNNMLELQTLYELSTNYMNLEILNLYLIQKFVAVLWCFQEFLWAWRMQKFEAVTVHTNYSQMEYKTIFFAKPKTWSWFAEI